ncbi:MAG TPA: SRPBCC family protein [Kofleriaceae bacterium]|nr:SRPBCC family protein [Kofleriaceae bacterium]
MNRDTEIALVRRVLGHIASGTTDTAAATYRQPADHYTSPERLARELARVFGRVPLAVAHLSELAAPGDFVTRRVGDVPVLVTRDRAGALRGFINVCRHRGTQVVADARGRGARGFACPYHAWSYGLDGALLAVPHANGFPGVEPGAAAGLVPLPTAAAAGFAWISLDREAPLDPAAWLGPLAAELDGLALPAQHVHDPRAIELAQNWKLAADGALETYHLRATHRRTIYPLFHDNLGLVDVFGPHIRTVFPKRSIAALAALPTAEWNLRAHANVLYLLFPNTILLVEPDHAMVLHTYPVGTDRCRFDAYALVPEPPISEKALAYWAANMAVFYGAVAEDFARGDSIQASLRSGANRELLFGRFEHALAAFHGALDAML